MKQKNILILVIIVVVVAFVIVLAITKNLVVRDVVKEDVQDETILSEFCRQVITRTQLREITDHQGNFVFEDREENVPEVGVVKTCDIRAEEMDLVGAAIGYFPLEVSYETLKQALSAVFPEAPREVGNVGEKAFSISMRQEAVPPQLEGEPQAIEDIVFPEMHQIIFLDGDINRIVGVGVQGFTYEILIELAKQVEANIK